MTKPPEDNYFELPGAKSKPVSKMTAASADESARESSEQDSFEVETRMKQSNTQSQTQFTAAGNTLLASIKKSNMSAVTKTAKTKKKSTKRIQKKATKVGREKMVGGDAVKSEKYKWRVIKLLGSGGFGDVYKVKKENNTDGDTKEYAMKTEMVLGNKRMLRLKIEVTVLHECHKTFPPNEKGRSNFVAFVDRGITDKFKFLIMGLVGPSLDDIRRTYLLKGFGKSTAMQAALQTLTSLKNLHTLGWLHRYEREKQNRRKDDFVTGWNRDIKPQNFAVGLPGDFEDLIYMLDFGISRKIFKEDGTKEMKLPRKMVQFLGTPRFASRACHRCEEQGRKDDLETWLFMVYDFFDQNTLVWKKAVDRQGVLRIKEKFFKHGYPTVYKLVPKEMKKLLDYCNGLSYYDQPDYAQIEMDLKTIACDNGINITKKLEWMGKLNKKPEKPKRDNTRFNSSSSESSDNQQSGGDTTTCTNG